MPRKSKWDNLPVVQVPSTREEIVATRTSQRTISITDKLQILHEKAQEEDVEYRSHVQNYKNGHSLMVSRVRIVDKLKLLANDMEMMEDIITIPDDSLVGSFNRMLAKRRSKESTKQLRITALKLKAEEEARAAAAAQAVTHQTDE